ncbi:MAG TPA: hypothetical protein VM284_01635 [Candidatus Limnocylindria bacterium]|nr:hypothetical protein [Candidatus Limnocylindria bacterium]
MRLWLVIVVLPVVVPVLVVLWVVNRLWNRWRRAHPQTLPAELSGQ